MNPSDEIPPKRDEAVIMVPVNPQDPPADSKPLFAIPPNPETGAMKGMSAEDEELKARLELAVERLKDPSSDVQRLALELIGRELKSSTSSMTAVPKPLKFLMPHYAGLKALFALAPNNLSKSLFADVLAVLGMVFGPEDARECLAFKLRGNATDVGSWGGEFARHLTGEVGAEWEARAGRHSALSPSAAAGAVADLLALVHVLVPYHLAHGAEHEAVDLLLEVHQLPLLLETDLGRGVSTTTATIAATVTAATPTPATVTTATVTATTTSVLDVDAPLQPHARVCAYLLKCGSYTSDSAVATECGTTAFAIWIAHRDAAAALRVALHLGGTSRTDRIALVFKLAGDDAATRRQLAFDLARQRATDAVPRGTLDAALEAVAGNLGLSEAFVALARDLDTLEPKTPEDIFKSHLEGGGGRGDARIDSARANLAKTYVNAFVNAGYGTDRLVTPADSDWVFKNKDHGQTAAAASLGLVHLWNEGQLSTLDKFLAAGEDSVKAGGILGIALASAGTRNPDADAALALLCGYADASDASVSTAQKSNALFGLGLAYAGAARDDIAELAAPFLASPTNAALTIDGAAAVTELAAMAALCIGLVFCGSAHEGHAALIASRLLEATTTEQGAPITRHLALGLALIFLGRGAAGDAILDVLDALGDVPLRALARALVTASAYAASGNAVALQQLLRVCAQHPEMEEREQSKGVAEEAKAAAALAVATSTLAGGTGAGAGAGAGAVTGAGAGAGAGAANGMPSLVAMAVGAGGAAAGGPLAVAAAAGAAARGGLPLLAPSPPDRKGTDVAGRFMHQSVAVLGLGLVAAGEALSIDMAGRVAEHLLQYGDTAVRRAVPLALAMTHLSDPDYVVVDQLSKLSHDPCEETAQASILALGLVGAGTNNSRIAGLLRTLATFYKQEPSALFVTRIAQGLLHMGKGLVSISPFHSDKLLCCMPALAGIMVFALAALDPKTTIHAKWHTLLYALAPAISPRSLRCVDEAGAPVKVDVRVGQAVDVVAQAGRPKTITGFQTHTTPVLLGVNDRAELADDTWIPFTAVLEGVVVVRINPAAAAKKKAEAERQEKKLKLGGGGNGVRARADLAWE